MALTAQQIERYSRQIIVPLMGGRGQERLLAARMLIAGDAREVEPVLSYLVGGGVGRIDLAVEPGRVERLESSMGTLNPDVTVAPRDCVSAAPDLGFAIIGSQAALERTADAIARFPEIGWVIARLDDPARIAVLPSPSPCPRCAGPELLSRFGTVSASAGVVAHAATVEALKLLAGYADDPQPAIIELDDYRSQSHPVAADSECDCGRRGA